MPVSILSFHHPWIIAGNLVTHVNSEAVCGFIFSVQWVETTGQDTDKLCISHQPSLLHITNVTNMLEIEVSSKPVGFFKENMLISTRKP